MSWADMIRDALAEDRFVLHAQPIVDLATGEVTQYELLLRMHGADGELIGPSAFLPVAERFDLMAAIDRWVVTRAIRMVGAERRRGRELTVEVNISGRSAGDPELLALIEQRAAHEPTSARARSSSRSPRRSPSRTSRAPSTSPRASPTSAAASRSTTSAPASAPSTTSSTCRSTTSRSTASSCATPRPTRRTSS